LTFEAIVRKFTNYRNYERVKQKITGKTKATDTINNAAATLLELKAFSKGRDLFKEENHSQITVRKTEILLSGEVTSSVGAYQRALRELWEEADQEDYEKRAKTARKDIFE
jgi:hypothetical protein